MNITEQELKKLEDAQDDMEWNKAVDEIKAARDGAFPPDWYAKVILEDLKFKIDLSMSITHLED
jgi:hypothetical protein